MAAPIDNCEPGRVGHHSRWFASARFKEENRKLEWTLFHNQNNNNESGDEFKLMEIKCDS